MKQHIDWNQFTELSFEQVNKLQKLVNQKYHLVKNADHWEELKNNRKVFLDGTIYNTHTSYIGILGKITIGKMVEILWDKKAPLMYKLVFNDTDKKDFDMECLCDELWEDIKQII